MKEPSLDFDEFSVKGSDGDQFTVTEEMDTNYNSDAELVCEAYDEDDDEDPLVKADEEINDFIRLDIFTDRSRDV